MLKLDPDDPDDEENAKVLSALSSGVSGATQSNAAPSILTEADQVALENYKVDLLTCLIFVVMCFF